jgi:hypothetical protein
MPTGLEEGVIIGLGVGVGLISAPFVVVAGVAVVAVGVGLVAATGNACINGARRGHNYSASYTYKN